VVRFLPAQPFDSPLLIGFKIILLDCVIGRRRIAIQPPPSSLAKRIILKPIESKYRFRCNVFSYPCDFIGTRPNLTVSHVTKFKKNKY
jgi:hypothetical protein